ncbi:hypothetical protein AX17_000368 [Amanita inopinata Kibby_2008]|nr:hypothetical protein AX17_000368 [Amanita inopinata Kibby_2008]
MSLATHTTVPDWLAAAGSVSYLKFVLKTLTERESLRDVARSVSRRQVPSPGRRPTPRFSPSRVTKQPTLKGTPAHYSVVVGCQPENALRNRYYQLEPYDRTRVVVGGGQGSEGRYLNASWVLERSGHKWWIAAQAPLPSTAHAFLSVILRSPACPPREQLNSTSLQPHLPSQRRVRTVVQLTQNFESGRRKAHAYFPSEVGKSLVITPEEGCTTPALKVTLLGTRSFDEAHCIQSTVSVVPVHRPASALSSHDGQRDVENTNGDEYYGEEVVSERVVFRHMLYTSWPDHGIPNKEDQASIISFVRLVDSTNRDISGLTHSEVAELDPDPPVMVGCSAGIGRTGSFISISSLLRSLGQLPPASFPTPASVLPPSPLNSLPAVLADDLVAQEVDFLREQRPRMVERDEQVLFIYEALAIGLGKV